MRNLLNVAAAVVILPWVAAGQDASAFLGRWDMTVTPANGTPYAQWMELIQKDGKIDGRVQPRGGAWNPIPAAKAEGGKLVVTVSSGKGPEVRWELTPVSADKLTGVEKRGEPPAA